MSLSGDLHHQIQTARKGKSGVIPIAYSRVSDYIDIAKNTMYTLVGESGSGKSTIAADLFMINPIQWYLQNKSDDLKLSIIYFGMERKAYQYTCRHISRLIFQEQGIEISPKKILGRNPLYRMTDKEWEMVQEYYKVIDEWEKDDLLITYEGSKNPTGILLYLEAFAEKHGKVIQKDKEDKSMENILNTKKYIPNHANHIVLIICDHIGILSPEKDKSAKANIDAFSRTMREARDIYGFSPVIVQQMNRNMSDIHRQKMGELTPKLSDIADSSSTTQDSDVVMALFDPFRHAIGGDPGNDAGYQLKKFKDDKFRTFYRSLHILKNSFDSSGMSFPIAMHPVYGILKTLYRKDQIPETIYDDVLSGKFFLEQQDNIESQVQKKAFSFNKQQE